MHTKESTETEDGGDKRPGTKGVKEDQGYQEVKQHRALVIKIIVLPSLMNFLFHQRLY